MGIRAILADGGDDLVIGGEDIVVIGTTAPGDVVRVLGGTITFNASFNTGGDTILLPGNRDDFAVSLEGSVAVFVSEVATVRIPVGANSTMIGFSDGTDMRALRFDTAASPVQLLLGDEIVGTAPSTGFTTGVDVVEGTAGDDRFEIDASQLQDGDRLLDPSSSDDDLLRVLVEGTAGQTVDFGSPQLQNVERVEVVDGGSASVRFDLADTSGLRQFAYDTVGGSLVLANLPMAGANDTAEVLLSGGGAGSSVAITLAQGGNPEATYLDLSLENVRLDRLDVGLATGEGIFNAAYIDIVGDIRIDTLAIDALGYFFRGEGDLRITNPLNDGFLAVDTDVTGDLEIRLGQGSQNLTVRHLDDNDILVGGSGPAQLNVIGGVDLSDQNQISGFSSILIQSDGEFVRYVMNARNGPADGYDAVVTARFASLPDTPSAFVFVADNDSVPRDFAIQVNGTYGVNNIDVSGGSKRDTVFTGGSNDAIFIGSTEQYGDGDFVRSGGGDDRIVVTGFGRITIDGGAGNDLFDLRFYEDHELFDIVGGDGDDTLHTLLAEPGRFDGGAGSDTLRVDFTNGVWDEIFGNYRSVENLLFKNEFSPGLPYTRQIWLGPLAAQAGVETVTFDDNPTTIEARGFTDALVVRGGSGNDRIEAGIGDDDIDLGAGADTLIGWLGADLLTGGEGADQFVYGFSEESNVDAFDTILDFSATQGDRIAFDFYVNNNGDDAWDPILWEGNFASLAAGTEVLVADDGNVQVFFVGDADGNGGFLYVDRNDDGQIGSGDIAVYLVGVSSLTIESLTLLDSSRQPPPGSDEPTTLGGAFMGLVVEPPLAIVDYSLA